VCGGGAGSLLFLDLLENFGNVLSSQRSRAAKNVLRMKLAGRQEVGGHTLF